MMLSDISVMSLDVIGAVAGPYLKVVSRLDGISYADSFSRQRERLRAALDGRHRPWQPLSSRVYNRGTSMDGDSRKEMRAIRDAVPQGDLQTIADQLRAMKRL